MNAVGMLEAIDNWLFIDATGAISQQYLSAFGKTSPSDANINRNQTETYNFSLSPYIRGTFLASTEYFLRYKAAIANQLGRGIESGRPQIQRVGQGRLSGNTRWGALGWALDASSLSSDYTVGRDYEDTRYQASLSYRFNPQIRVSAFAGQESQNYVSTDLETRNTHGFGLVDAQPTHRTRGRQQPPFLREWLRRQFSPSHGPFVAYLYGQQEHLVSASGCREHRAGQQLQRPPTRSSRQTTLAPLPGLDPARRSRKSFKAEVFQPTGRRSTAT